MKKILLILLLLLSLVSCSCKKNQAFSKTYFDYFDTVITITGYETSENKFLEKIQIIEPLIKEYHQLYDIYNEYDKPNLCTINKNAYIKPIQVDQKIIDLIKYSKTISNLTNHMFNIAMGSVLKLWQQEREKALKEPYISKLPDENKLKESGKYINQDNIIIDEQNQTVFITNPYTKIDVGAIAKGYATEQIAKQLIKNNATSYILNFGGNIKLIGSKPNNKNFKIDIQAPIEGSTKAITTLKLKNYSVVTSGSYNRYYYVGEKKYHHIINPTTLYPENRFLSVTVVGKNSGLCDALSTALFNLSVEEGTKIIEKFEDIYVLWIDQNQQMIYSNGFKKNFL